MKAFLITLAVLVSALTAAAAKEPVETPNFIKMYGAWESAGVKSEPPEVLIERPHLAMRHIIHGKKGLGQIIHFTVEQGDRASTLTYVHDAATGKSFGVIIDNQGSVLRGEIVHGDGEDNLTLTNANGDVVWTETKTWISPSEFHSEGVMPYKGGKAKVWFVTNKIEEE